MAVSGTVHLGAHPVDLTSSGSSRELESRLHVVEGLLDALGRLDQVNKVIQLSNSRHAALAALQQEPFRYTREQAKAVLEMPMSSQCAEAAGELRRERDRLVVRHAPEPDLAAEALPANWFG